MDRYRELRLSACREALEGNNFEAFVAESPADAKQIVIDRILPAIGDVECVSWGDSLTLYATEVLEHFRNRPGVELIETFARNTPRTEIMERRRKALLGDLFLPAPTR
jgi:hypothetical protein